MSSGHVTHATPTSRRAIASAVLAAVALISYAAASTVDDGFYAICGLLGLAGLLVGLNARRETGRSGPGARLALAGIIVGGLFAVAVGAFTAVWGISQLI